MGRALKAVVKTKSRRQSIIVCSLLMVSLLLSAAAGEECVQGILPQETVNMYGPSSRSEELPSTFGNRLYIFPSMNFNCNGTITDIRMRMDFVTGQRAGIGQEVVVYFLLFHDGLNSPTRRVSYILLNQTNTQQEFPNQIWNNSDPLSLPVTKGTFIGFAVPGMKSPTIFTKNINLGQTSELVEAHFYKLDADFSEFEERVLETARTASSSQFTPQTIALPLIDVNFSPDSSTELTPSSTPHPSSTLRTILTSTSTPTLPHPTSTPTPSTGLSQLMIIVIAVVACTVLLVLVVLLVIVMVMVVCRRRIKDKNELERGQKGSEMDCKPVTASFALTNTINSDTTIGRAANVSLKGSEGAETHDTLLSPTTGQLKDEVTIRQAVDMFTACLQAAGDDRITYAVPTTTKKEEVQEETSGYKTPLTYDTACRKSLLFVPTMDERAKYASPEGLSVHYALPSMNPEVSQHYEFPSTESEHYWCPADNEPDLYRQLSQRKYQEIPRSSVIQDAQIGEGEFGVVCRGEWKNMGGVVQQVAIKMLHNEDDKVKFLQEAAAMGQFNHPHVARLFGVVTMGKPVMIVMELLEKGDLRSYLLTVDPSKHPNLTPLLMKFSRQIADGMAHLSSKDFIHRDLATRNILLDRQLNCKIADFGMSRDLTNQYYMSQGGRIPLKWTAPEALLYHKYSTGSDVWSYGMVLFEIWSLGHKPFEEETAEQLVQLFSSGNGYCQPPPPGCPREVYAVMVQCWNPDHHKRPRFAEVFASLSRPELLPSSFGEELDLESVPPTALVLGSPLDAAKHLYLDLQHTYTKKK